MIRNKEVRLTNFLKLSESYEKIADFCKVIQIAPSYYSQVKRGTKVIGDEIAERVENALGLPHGWMDTTHSTEAEQIKALPTDVVGVAYAIASLPEGVRERVKGLVYEMAAEYSKIESERAKSADKRRGRREDGNDGGIKTQARMHAYQ